MATTDATLDQCPACGAPWARTGGESKTLVGYSSQPGHDHDDNCRRRAYVCAAGHERVFSARAKCPAEGCGWIGKESCDSCGGAKVARWPEIRR
jgi:hypothetical protein